MERMGARGAAMRGPVKNIPNGRTVPAGGGEAWYLRAMMPTRIPYRASRREMTALVLLPALVGLMFPVLRPTPVMLAAALMLLWAVVSVLRRRDRSVRAWVDDVHLVVGGLVVAAWGVKNRPDAMFVLLAFGCLVQGLVATGLLNGWWEKDERAGAEANQTTTQVSA